jgi:hypothetical protein
MICGGGCRLAPRVEASLPRMTRPARGRGALPAIILHANTIRIKSVALRFPGSLAMIASGADQARRVFASSKKPPVERDRMSAAPAPVSPHGTAHMRPGYVRHGRTLSERVVSRSPAGSVDAATTPEPATADQQQAEYFMRLLGQRARYIDRRLDDFQKAIAVSEVGGDAETVRDVRRRSRADEKDRQAVKGLIDNLQRRFPVRVSGEVPHTPRQARPAIR